jgi:hypothetical protein
MPLIWVVVPFPWANPTLNAQHRANEILQLPKYESRCDHQDEAYNANSTREAKLQSLCMMCIAPTSCLVIVGVYFFGG